MKKKQILFAALSLLLLFSFPVNAEENDRFIGTVLTSPLVWCQETLGYYRDVILLPFGVNGNPQDNWDYAGNGNDYGYYDTFSDESGYRYSRYGVN